MYMFFYNTIRWYTN